jgi:DNA-binding response OmpR family regulator
MVDFLTAAGYLCESVFTYRDALQKIEYHSYDCIVLGYYVAGWFGP